MINDEPKLNLSNLKKLEESQICKIILEQIQSQYPSPYIIKVLLSSYIAPIDTTEKTISEHDLKALLKMISEKVGKLNIVKYLLDLEFYQKNSEKLSEISTENTPTPSKNNQKINPKFIISDNIDSHFNLETDKVLKVEQCSFLSCSGNKRENYHYNSDDNKGKEIQNGQQEEINADKIELESNGGSEIISLNSITDSDIIYLTDNDSEDKNKENWNDIKLKSKKKFLGKKTRNNVLIHSKQEGKERKILSGIKPSKKLELGNHYSIGKGYFYKYCYGKREGSIAKFICADKMCKSIGKYNIKEKTFQLVKIHNLLPGEHSYNKNYATDDLKILKFMKRENIEEMQFKK